ncbi:MAG: PTS sugar transporter subunit IIA [Anaerorhabdus sp.]|uniref:PTS sugar transporter subunit IIA n=1 Tax=Anaerorhabdus sp. TaxID=1872524 RepID=UPI002B2043CC|nr:PTS sugar transporter subunit IIA [Anaerorhabdus sp.]MEA4874665.1 PTS sugar transporter subunit IIA [Anaerorhabdus sp.]
MVASHGEFAKAAVETVEMIAGPQDNTKAVVLHENMSLEQFEDSMKQAIQELKKNCEDIVIFCDIYGGTPFNVTSKLKLTGYEFLAFTGFNLPILMDLCFSRDCSLDEITERIKETHANSCTEINPIVPNEESEIDL